MRAFLLEKAGQDFWWFECPLLGQNIFPLRGLAALETSNFT